MINISGKTLGIAGLLFTGVGTVLSGMAAEKKMKDTVKEEVNEVYNKKDEEES